MVTSNEIRRRARKLPIAQVKMESHISKRPRHTELLLKLRWPKINWHGYNLRKPVHLMLTVAIVAGIVAPIWNAALIAARYRIGQGARVLAPFNSNLISRVSYDGEQKAWVYSGSESEGLALKSGATGFSATIPKDPSKGIKLEDLANKVSLTITPQFKTLDTKLKDSRFVQPLDSQPGQAVYTIKANGLKEDLILHRSPGDTADYDYRLDLPDTMEARLLENGGVGVFGADSALYGNITFGSEEDRQRVEAARRRGQKTNLLFAIPAPVIHQAGGATGGPNASFKLNGNLLTVHVEGLDGGSYPLSIDPSFVVTSANDFQNGNAEDNIDFSNGGQISRKPLTGGTVSSWTSVTPTGPNAHAEAGAFVADGKLYKMGAISNKDIYYQTIAADGSVAAGGWTQSATTIPPVGGNDLSWYGLQYYNGYVYLLGGTNGSAGVNNTFYAKLSDINSTTTAATWNSGTALPYATGASGTAVYNGYLYVLGGRQTASSLHDEVLIAPIRGDGSIGSWTTDTTHKLASGRWQLQAAAYNGYLYYSGGCTTNSGAANSDCGTPQNTVYYTKINSDGTINNWTALGSFTTIRGGHNMTAANGYLYIAGGCTGSSPSWCNIGSVLSDVQMAPIYSDGTIGAWQATTAFGTARYLAGMAAHNGNLYMVDGCIVSSDTACSTSTNWLNDVQYVAIDGVGRLGSTFSAGSSMTTARHGFGSAVYDGVIYVVGGCSQTNPSACNAANGFLASVEAANINSDGTISAWFDQAKPLPAGTGNKAGRYGLSVVAHNGYLYAAGGFEANVLGTTIAAMQDVYVAKISDNEGELVKMASPPQACADATWCLASATNNPITTARAWSSAIAQNGFFYYIGGNTSVSFNANTTSFGHVTKATINADGSLSSFSETDSLATATAMATAVVVNGYILVLGGRTGGASMLTTVQRAKINTDGTLGAWTTSGNTAFTTGRQLPGVAVYNGILYVFGGTNATGTTNTVYSDVQYSVVASDGTNGAWTTTQSLGTARYGFGSVAANGYIYVWGGCSGWNTTSQACTGELSSTESAVINNGGHNTTKNYTVQKNMKYPRDASAVAAYNNYLYILGGYNHNSSTAGALTEVLYAPMSGDGTIGAWNTTTSLPVGRLYHSAATHNGYVYVLGGCDSWATNGCNGNMLSSTLYAQLNGDGTIGTWNTTTSFTTARISHATVARNGFIYVTGGYASGGVLQNDVQYAPLNGTTGAIGTWASTNTFSTARWSHQAMVSSGYLYITGGCTSNNLNCAVGSFRNDTQYALICTGSNSGTGGCGATAGTVGTWNTNTDLNTYAARYLFAGGYYGGYIYVMGGTDGNAKNDVLYAKTNADGSLASQDCPFGSSGQTWCATSNLNMVRLAGMGIAAGGYIYSVGGYNSGYLSDVQVATLSATNGSTGTFTHTTNFSIARYVHSTVAYNGYVYMIGGSFYPNATATVYYAAIQSDGSLGAWAPTTSLPAARAWHSSAVYGGYIYITGGCTDWPNNNCTGPGISNGVLYTKPNADGTLGAWTAANSLITAREAHATVATNGHLYVLGGATATAGINDVQYAKINSDGSLGAWASTSSFTTARFSHAAVAANGYMYVLAGCSQGNCDAAGIRSDVQYAKINSNGTLGTWNFTTSMPFGRYWHTGNVVVANGYIYSVSGFGPTEGETNTVFAAIQADGTLGTWYKGASMASGVAFALGGVVTYNGYMYVVSGAGGNNDGTLNLVEYAPFKTIPRVAHFSKLFDADIDVTPAKLVVGGTLGSGAFMPLTLRSATNTTQSGNTAHVFNSPRWPSYLLSQPAAITADPGGVDRYYWLHFTIDDTGSAPAADISQSNITDMTLYYHPGSARRLRGGKTFTGGAQQGLDAAP